MTWIQLHEKTVSRGICYGICWVRVLNAKKNARILNENRLNCIKSSYFVMNHQKTHEMDEWDWRRHWKYNRSRTSHIITQNVVLITHCYYILFFYICSRNEPETFSRDIKTPSSRYWWFASKEQFVSPKPKTGTWNVKKIRDEAMKLNTVWSQDTRNERERERQRQDTEHREMIMLSWTWFLGMRHGSTSK